MIFIHILFYFQQQIQTLSFRFDDEEEDEQEEEEEDYQLNNDKQCLNDSKSNEINSELIEKSENIDSNTKDSINSEDSNSVRFD